MASDEQRGSHINGNRTLLLANGKELTKIIAVVKLAR